MHPDVIGDVEGGSVDPQRPAHAQPRSVQQLPEARHKVQPRLELLADRLDPDTAVAIEQLGAVEDGEPADVGGPTIVVPEQQEEVRRGQPLQETPLGHHVTLRSLRAVSAISSTKAAGASKGAAWAASSIRCVLAPGMAAANDRVRRTMKSGLRAP